MCHGRAHRRTRSIHCDLPDQDLYPAIFDALSFAGKLSYRRSYGFGPGYGPPETSGLAWLQQRREGRHRQEVKSAPHSIRLGILHHLSEFGHSKGNRLWPSGNLRKSTGISPGGLHLSLYLRQHQVLLVDNSRGIFHDLCCGQSSLPDNVAGR